MRLTDRALSRAVLARQGLLEPWTGPLVPVIESIGALQAQYWPSIPVALWSRLAESPATRSLHAEVLRYATGARRSLADLGDFIERRVTERPEEIDPAELARQRSYRFRPLITSTRLVRVPSDGVWDGRTPRAYQAVAAGEPPDPDTALSEVAHRYLGAFGPAGADDLAGWIGWPVPPVRAVLARLDLLRLTDESGRTLYDRPNAPRPDPDTPAPVRFLPAFDSVLLAYAAKRRTRILPDAYRGRVYLPANLKWLPTFLVDGMVAGVWSDALQRREATLTLTVFDELTRTATAELRAEAGRLIRFRFPTALSHRVAID